MDIVGDLGRFSGVDRAIVVLELITVVAELAVCDVVYDTNSLFFDHIYLIRGEPFSIFILGLGAVIVARTVVYTVTPT